MIFKKVLFNYFDSMLLSSLIKNWRQSKEGKEKDGKTFNISLIQGEESKEIFLLTVSLHKISIFAEGPKICHEENDGR